ncbi:hypothetical protein KEM52_001798, partial [Ascosphaera acerosa]
AAHYSSDGVRERTAQLASLVVSETGSLTAPDGPPSPTTTYSWQPGAPPQQPPNGVPYGPQYYPPMSGS